MEHRGGGAASGLVRGAGLCLRGAIGASGENAESCLAAESAVSRAGGQDHRAAARRYAGDQRHAEDYRDAAAISRFSVLSHDVPEGVSEWSRVLSVRAVAQDCGQSVAGWIAS